MNPASSPPDAAGLLETWLAALLDGDRRAAFRIIAEAQDAGASLEQLYMQVLQPALREVGRLWEANEITVADEHFATAVTQAVMGRAFQQRFQWAGDEGRTLIAACPDLERHEIGLRMICDLLELDGWDTTYLGATVPADSLVAMVVRRRPDVLALSTALPPHLPRLADVITAVRNALGDEAPVILVGGRPFVEDPTLAGRLGADLTAADAVAAVATLRNRLPPA